MQILQNKKWFIAINADKCFRVCWQANINIWDRLSVMQRRMGISMTRSWHFLCSCWLTTSKANSCNCQAASAFDNRKFPLSYASFTLRLHYLGSRFPAVIKIFFRLARCAFRVHKSISGNKVNKRKKKVCRDIALLNLLCRFSFASELASRREKRNNKSTRLHKLFSQLFNTTLVIQFKIIWIAVLGELHEHLKFVKNYESLKYKLSSVNSSRHSRVDVTFTYKISNNESKNRPFNQRAIKNICAWLGCFMSRAHYVSP